MNAFILLAQSSALRPLSVTLQVLTVIAAALLVLIVLFQDSKGGGLEAAFGGGGANMGSGGANRRVIRITAIMAGVFVALVLVTSLVENHIQGGAKLKVEEKEAPAETPAEAPDDNGGLLDTDTGDDTPADEAPGADETTGEAPGDATE